MTNVSIPSDVKVIIGLGNPGKAYEYTRHNIGFLILDALAADYGVQWKKKKEMEVAEIDIDERQVLLVKPQTFMNSSGKVIPMVLQHGITVHNLLVVHDELEKPFGALSFKVGGSHRGHNGLRSIIGFCGSDFVRLRFGIGRPEGKEADVGDYVLKNFEKRQEVESLIDTAVAMIKKDIL